MPEQTAKAHAVKSAVRARVEHPFAHQKNRMGLFIRTLGLATHQGQDHPDQSDLQYEPPDLP